MFSAAAWARLPIRLRIVLKPLTRTSPGGLPSTAAGHAGKLVTGRLGGTEVSCSPAARIYYEGYTGAASHVRHSRAGASAASTSLVLTNAAGGIDTELHPGELVLISDHINLMGGIRWSGAMTTR